MNYRKVTVLATLMIALAACGGGLTQADVDAAVQAALASTSTTEPGTTTTTTMRVTTTTTRPTTTTAAQPALEASDFVAEIDVLESSCFGSAGANVRFVVLWGWPGEAYGTLTYEISGLDDGAVNVDTTEIRGREYSDNEHFVGIPSCNADSITVVPTRFRPGG